MDEKVEHYLSLWPQRSSQNLWDAFKEVESSKTIVYSRFENVITTRHGRGGRQQTTEDTFDADEFISDIVGGDLVNLCHIRAKITQLNYEKTKLVYLSAVKKVISKCFFISKTNFTCC